MANEFLTEKCANLVAGEILDNTDEVCNPYRSLYGNDYLQITEEQITALREGKVLFFDNGEYNTFLILSSTEVTND